MVAACLRIQHVLSVPFLLPSKTPELKAFSFTTCSVPHPKPKSCPVSPPPTPFSKPSSFVSLGSRADETSLTFPAHNSAGGFFWSCLHGGTDGEGQGDGDSVCSGDIATLLMSTTGAAVTKAKASPFLSALAGNRTFISGLLAWALAQMLKVALNFFVERKMDLGMFFSCGGMPSSHSALCMALTASVAFCHGVGDSLFAVCLGFSLVVMYDAIGVRRHAGMQAEILNKIVEDLFQGHPISQRKLKELLGHTPSQVVAGALLGGGHHWIHSPPHLPGQDRRHLPRPRPRHKQGRPCARR
ncbi:hypothetical protein HPP92_020191 [Vanilla planifolia]|uniref:Acid phosphatase/vanadium-dependent haloperoxidase-related protein n=1 Tax=Vanilla planifolia TaxID=51239 RepID=A0A835UJM3_VANPL|nr:hypothetical protein HPP92_020191 [Vanilla planifolia]